MVRPPARRTPNGPHGRGFRAGVSRLIGDADNPLHWALPLGSVAGVRVRVHLFFLLYAGATILFSMLRHEMGAGYTALAMAALFALVLVHEFGHALGARRVGGDASDILLWPLGGLAPLTLPERWKAHLIATLAGPAVHVALAPVFIGAMLAAGLGEALLFNPLRLGATLASPVFDAWWKVLLFWLHAINLLLLGFNALLPMFPLDGGRILRALLWARVGYRRATERSLAIGFVTACVVAIAGLAAQQAMLVAVGVFAGLVCWDERRRLHAPELLTGGFDLGLDDGEIDPLDAAAERHAEHAAKARAEEAERQAEVDRILAKIAATGLESLSKAERAALARETERKRRG